METKEKHSFYLWRSFVKAHWGVYLIGSLAVLLTDFMQVAVTRTLGWVLDFFGKNPIPEFFAKYTERETFFILFIILLSARIFLFIGRVGWRLTLARQTHHAAAMLRRKIWDNVRFFKRERLDTEFTKGVLMNSSTSDVNSARFIFGFTLVAVMDVLFLGIFTFFTMLTIHVEMTFWSLGVLIFLPFFVKKLSRLEIERYGKAQEFLSEFNDLAAQVVSTIRLQRLTQTGKFWERRLLKSAEDYRQKRLSAVFTSLKYIPIMGMASVVSFLVLFVLGINFVLKGQMSVGDFVSMQGLIFLLQDPLFELGFIISDWKKAGTSLDRLERIYSEEKETSLTQSGQKITEHPIVLNVEGLKFSHTDSPNALFKDFNLSINKGERLGISGPIGSGKSTLVGILSGLERKLSGKVHFSGRPFSDYSHSELRNHIGHVPQRPFLFADTIKQNIRMDKDLSDDEVWHYLKLAGLDSDVDNFAEKLETPLGEWGINLSGGQKQRLTLARALSKKPKVLFLDDCLSAVDTVTEEKILKNLDRELKETTLIWVAHRKSTLKYCTQFLEL